MPSTTGFMVVNFVAESNSRNRTTMPLIIRPVQIRFFATTVVCSDCIGSCSDLSLLPGLFAPGLLLPSCFGADSILLRPELRSERLSEVIVLENLSNLDFGILEWSALEPLDRLFLGPDLPQPEP